MMEQGIDLQTVPGFPFFLRSVLIILPDHYHATHLAGLSVSPFFSQDY